MTMKDMIVGPSSKLSKGQKLPWEPFAGNKQPTSFEESTFMTGFAMLTVSLLIPRKYTANTCIIGPMDVKP